MAKPPSKYNATVNPFPEDARIILVGLPRYGDKYQTLWTNILMLEYYADLKFPKPRSRDFTPWKFMGIHITNDNGIDTYMRLRNMSHHRKGVRYAVVLFGKKCWHLKRAVEPNPNHLVVCLDHPMRTTGRSDKPIKGSRLFSRCAEHVNQPLYIWRLP